MAITLTLPDSPAMRAVLRDLSIHCYEDNAPACEEQAEEAAFSEDSDERAKAAGLGDQGLAYVALGDAITNTLFVG